MNLNTIWTGKSHKIPGDKIPIFFVMYFIHFKPIIGFVDRFGSFFFKLLKNNWKKC